MKFTPNVSVPLLFVVFGAVLQGCGGAAPETATANASPTPSSIAVSSAAVSSVISSSSSAPQSSDDNVAESSLRSSSSAYQRVSRSSKSAAESSIASSVAIAPSLPSPSAGNPSQPGKPQAKSLEPRSITLSWEPSLSTKGILAYKIFRNGFNIATIEGDQTQYESKNLVPEDTYTYFIVALNRDNLWSKESESTTFTTPKEMVSSSTGLSSRSSIQSSSAASSSIALSSSQSSARQSSRSSSSSFSSSSMISSALSSSKSSTLSSSSASSRANQSSALSSSSRSSMASSSSASSTPDVIAPTKVTALKSSNETQTSLLIGWDASTDAVGVAKYEVMRDGSKIATLSAATLTFNDSGLTAGKIYKYKVLAYDAANNFSTSDELIVSTKSAAGTTWTISWTHPDSRENGAVLGVHEIGGYEIRYKKPTDARYTYVDVKGNGTTEYVVPRATLDGADIQIAVYDTNGVYSRFVDVKP